MKCLECGTNMKATRENVKYDASGLSGVTLQDVEVRRCPNCGEYEVVIPHLENLHRSIAQTIAQRSDRLSPQEVVFLRKYLGWDGATFARRIGTTAETVSRWEHGSPIGVQAERLLRLMVLFEKRKPGYSLDEFQNAATGDPSPFRAKFVTTPRQDWKAA